MQRFWSILHGAVFLLAVLFVVPNLLPAKQLRQMQSWLPLEQVNLGLDLQGGSYLLLGLDTDALVEEKLLAAAAELRQLLREKNFDYRYVNVRDGKINLAFDDVAERQRLADYMKDVFDYSYGSGYFVIDGSNAGNDSEASGIISAGFAEGVPGSIAEAAVVRSIGTIRKRVDEFGVNEPSIYRQGKNKIVVQLPGLSEPERIKDLLGKTAKLEFRVINRKLEGNIAEIPPGYQRMYHYNEYTDSEDPYIVEDQPVVVGENLIDAQPTFEDERPVILITFDPTGGRNFARATTDNLGGAIAVVLDGKIISPLNVQQAILNSRAIIKGSFTVEEAQNFAVLLRSGALPADMNILEERVIGPGLGQEAVDAGKFATVAAFIAVVTIMLIIYRSLGIFSSFALVFNILLIFAALSILQATLTLPGIVGIALTVGMAVDSNVLIFERIQEEKLVHKNRIQAINEGYRKALSSVLDANITTLLAALVLFWLGSGPIRGFAVTLGLGVVGSMYTATVVTRMLMLAWARFRQGSKVARNG